MAWLTERFPGVDNSTHLQGNCIIEFVSDDKALVETYYVSRYLRAPVGDERKSGFLHDRVSDAFANPLHIFLLGSYKVIR